MGLTLKTAAQSKWQNLEIRAHVVKTSVKPNKPSEQGLSISDMLSK